MFLISFNAKNMRSKFSILYDRYDFHKVRLRLIFIKQQMSKKQPLKKQKSQSSNKQLQFQSSPTPETEQERIARENQMIMHLNRDNIHRYLETLRTNKRQDDLAIKAINYSAEKITHYLKIGHLQIPKNPPPLSEEDRQMHRLSTEEQKELDKKANRENIAKKIDYLYKQIRGEINQEEEIEGQLKVQFKDILNKQQHQKKVRDIMAEKEQRRKRMIEIQQQQKRKRQQEQQKQAALKAIQQQKVKQLKRKQIQRKIQKRKKQHNRFIQIDTKLQKEVIQAKNKTRLYEQMQKKYQSQMHLPFLQERKKKLREIRDFHKRNGIDTIKEHEKQYLNKSLQKTRERKISSPQWTYNAPPRSKRLDQFLKNQEGQFKQQQQQHLRKLEEKQKRQQLYMLQLKQKHKPKIDETKRQQIELRLIREKQRYDRAHPSIDLRRLGQSYLEIAKKMKRVQSTGDTLNRTQKQLQNNEQKPQTSRISHSSQFFEELRKKKLQNLINSDDKPVQQKYLMLRMEAEKLGEKLRQKQEKAKFLNDRQAQDETAQLLLLSIKAQMGIVNLLQKNNKSNQENY